MHSITMLLLSSAVLAAAGPPPAQAPPLTRKPGWWELTLVTTLGATKPTRQVIHICTDPTIDRVQTPSGVHMGRGCPPVETTRAGDGWRIAASCKVDATTMSVSGRMTGDLNSAYHVALVTHLDPPPTPSVAKVDIGMDARWLGACPAGKKPGDLDLSMSVASATETR